MEKVYQPRHLETEKESFSSTMVPFHVPHAPTICTIDCNIPTNLSSPFLSIQTRLVVPMWKPCFHLPLVHDLVALHEMYLHIMLELALTIGDSERRYKLHGHKGAGTKFWQEKCSCVKTSCFHVFYAPRSENACANYAKMLVVLCKNAGDALHGKASPSDVGNGRHDDLDEPYGIVLNCRTQK